MSHLSSERLAALVDEAPTTSELAHLAGCAECARERAAFQALAEFAAGESSRIGAPLTKWETLAPVLVSDGVIDRGRGLPFRKHAMRRPWLQAAAAVLLVAGGMVGGRLTAGAPALPAPKPIQVATSPEAAPTFASIEEAQRAQEQAQTLFQTATAYLAERDTSSLAATSPSAMQARLAALDRAREVMGEALNDAPYDPVINGYYLTTLGQREATLRQLNTVLPASMRITSY